MLERVKNLGNVGMGWTYLAHEIDRNIGGSEANYTGYVCQKL